MKTLDHNAISRSMMLMGFRLSDQMFQKRHEADHYRLSEVIQEYQVTIRGTAGSGAYTDFTINFAEVIYYAPLQRTNKNEDPQVSHGVQLDSGDAFFTVIVKRWLLDDSANYLGAIVRVGVMQAAWDPGATYAGTVHISFQGLSIPAEDPGFDETP